MFRQILAGAFCALASVTLAAAEEAPVATPEAPAAAESAPPVKKERSPKLDCRAGGRTTGSILSRRTCTLRQPREESAKAPEEQQNKEGGNQDGVGSR